MNRKRFCMAMVIMTIAIFFYIHLNMVGGGFHEMDSDSTSELLGIDYRSTLTEATQNENSVNETITTEMPIQEIEPSPIETPIPSPTNDSKPIVSQPKDAFAEVTIKTDRKTGSYTVMSDVYENTLRHNIGWLPSSAVPGGDGVCVFMGHRDTDFRILQYLKTGDEIIVEREKIKFTYTVYKTEIINSDSELRFDILSDANLVLVTCYPFRYSGHAPQKFVVLAKMN